MANAFLAAIHIIFAIYVYVCLFLHVLWKIKSYSSKQLPFNMLINIREDDSPAIISYAESC